jgi:hypothetical protein
MHDAFVWAARVVAVLVAGYAILAFQLGMWRRNRTPKRLLTRPWVLALAALLLVLLIGARLT